MEQNILSFNITTSFLNRLTSFTNGKVGRSGAGHHQRCCYWSFWALSIAGFDIFSPSAKSGRRFPISPCPALFFPTQFEAGMTYEEQASDNNRVKLFAQTQFGNDLFELQLNIISNLSCGINTSLNAEPFICFCGEYPIAVLWLDFCSDASTYPFKKSPAVEGQWMSACCARWSFGIMSL